ncbi:MAG: exosortase/archaeosortase family protein [Planctomycetota bacterium]
MTTVDSSRPVGVGSGGGRGLDVSVASLASRRGLIAAAVLSLPFIALFSRTLIRQHNTSLSHFEDWGHAYFVPIISGFLVWQRRHLLAAIDWRPFWPAVTPLLVGIVAYFFVVVGVRSHFPEGVAMLLTLYGAVLFLLGPAAMRALFIPLLFLGFAITLPEAWMLEITFKLKQIASSGSEVVLAVIGQITGFGVERDGNIIRMLPAGGEPIPMNVADACSGMRMVVAFYALAGAFGMTSCSLWWQRIALLLLAGPIALGMNIIRVSVLGLVSLGDPDLASGDAHTLIGTILLIPSIGLFFAVVWALKKIVRDPGGGES